MQGAVVGAGPVQEGNARVAQIGVLECNHFVACVVVVVVVVWW